MDEMTRQYRAQRSAQQAVIDGKLDKPDTCELCGDTPGRTHFTRKGKPCSFSNISAHHWRGYDHPLDVWFICKSCNHRLQNKRFHNGSVSKKEARRVVLEKRDAPPPKPSVQCEALTPQGHRCNNRVKDYTHCWHHR